MKKKDGTQKWTQFLTEITKNWTDVCSFITKSFQKSVSLRKLYTEGSLVKSFTKFKP